MTSTSREFMRQAEKIPGLKIVFGSDALAGSHGRNAEEFVDRVRDVGVDPMKALVSANSLGAEALVGSPATEFQESGKFYEFARKIQLVGLNDIGRRHPHLDFRECARRFCGCGAGRK